MLNEYQLGFLKNHGPATHPWRQSGVNKLMTKLRQTIPDGQWVMLKDALEKAKQGDIELWETTWKKIIIPYTNTILEDYKKAEEKKVNKENKLTSIKTKKDTPQVIRLKPQPKDLGNGSFKLTPTLIRRKK